ncbi:hypothetical protein I6B53_04975 [Schaalia sp. 19OD2882]|uniref:hypothetical protein n=1 Tax=Schaalia sp. 19OD2882 TaxID=2794089 RepID=UPI001C1EE909|nr:hypothetical protein [Schaalia sp. 19OD2882]QWW20431.1 hypothetical protein I6B53_04975 [Schaalia sp. 19OD2882]
MSEESVDVLVFSDDADTRKAVIDGVGIKASKNSPRITWHEAATTFGVTEAVGAHDFALIVMDAEAKKHGGMGIAKELENTVDRVPPIIYLTARQQDEWLATWAGAAATIARPLDPMRLQEAVAAVLSCR